MVTAASVQATAEALALVQASGLPAEKFLAAMKQNASYSKTVAMKLPKMIERDFERHFSVQHMLKDMQIASRLGLSHHLELGVTGAARDRLLEQIQRGHGDEDYSAVARKYFRDAKSGAEAELELFQEQSAQPPVAEAKERPAAIPASGVSSAVEAEAAKPTEEDPAATALVPALEALQTHVPAAPFLNPIGAAEPVAEQAEAPAKKMTSEPVREFLTEPTPQLAEQEESEPRGFFSRLLRRANT